MLAPEGALVMPQIAVSIAQFAALLPHPAPIVLTYFLPNIAALLSNFMDIAAQLCAGHFGLGYAGQSKPGQNHGCQD